MNRLLKVILILSLVLNTFLIYEDFFNHPDIDFFQTGRNDAYLVKKDGRVGYFVIEHKDKLDGLVHKYTAKCQSTLTWQDGILNPGQPMSDSCIYLPGYIGKTIAAGMMRKEGDKIVYMAWTNMDTVQTADVLTILDDQVVGK